MTACLIWTCFELPTLENSWFAREYNLQVRYFCYSQSLLAIPGPFFKDCLLEINKYRKLHGALPLRWNDDLQYHAQSRADQLAEDKYLQNDIEPLDLVGQGETVSYLSPYREKCTTFPPAGDCYACRESIATWYNESQHYNYDTGYSFDGTKQVLHFTQVSRRYKA